MQSMFLPVPKHWLINNLQYVRFWESPASISVLWLGVLFGVMSISSFLAGHNQQETLGIQNSVAADNTVQTYRAMTIHCLVAGDYLRHRQYTIEALILHFANDQILNVDGTVSNWVLMGVVVRLALRMGLHRDPSHWPSIQPLQAELRRRLWISLYQMDFSRAYRSVCHASSKTLSVIRSHHRI